MTDPAPLPTPGIAADPTKPAAPVAPVTPDPAVTTDQFEAVQVQQTQADAERLRGEAHLENEDANFVGSITGPITNAISTKLPLLLQAIIDWINAQTKATAAKTQIPAPTNPTTPATPTKP